MLLWNPKIEGKILLGKKYTQAYSSLDTVKLICPFWGKGPATVYQPPIRELLLLSKPIRFG